MGMELMARYRLPDAERAGSGDGATILERLGPDDRIEMRVVHADGSTDPIAVPRVASGMIADILTKLAQSEEVALLSSDAEISPEDAATILGISRPLVRRRMDAGLLPFRRVGAHRRLKLSDVLTLREREAPVRAALEALRADTEELMALGL